MTARRPFELDTAVLEAAIGDLGLEVAILDGFSFDDAAPRYVPARVLLSGETINTGFTLAVPSGWPTSFAGPTRAPGGGDESADVRQHRTFSVVARDTPDPVDVNELPLAWFVVAALARLGHGQVEDPQGDVEAPTWSEITARLAQERRSFDSSQDAWSVYPFALFDASSRGDLREVIRQLEAGAGIEARDHFGRTPLLLAAREGHLEILRHLMARGADPCAVDRWESSALTSALARHDVEMTRLLISFGADTASPAWTLAESGDQELLEILIDAGGSIDVATPGGWTPLTIAISNRHEDLAVWLLQRGADFGIENSDGATVLMIAADNGLAEVVEVLIARGVDVNHESNDEPLVKSRRRGAQGIDARGHA